MSEQQTSFIATYHYTLWRDFVDVYIHYYVFLQGREVDAAETVEAAGVAREFAVKMAELSEVAPGLSRLLASLTEVSRHIFFVWTCTVDVVRGTPDVSHSIVLLFSDLVLSQGGC